MQDEVLRLKRSFRRIWITFAACFALSAIAWLIIPGYRPYTEGLLLGEVGGAYVIFSMIRQGHLQDEATGNALMLSGMLGMFTRFIVLAVVMVIAIKLPPVNPYTTLAGYLLGLVIMVSGMAIHERSKPKTTGKIREESR